MLEISQEHSERCYSHSTFHSLTKQKSPDYGKTNLSMLQFRSDEHNTKSGGTQGLKDFGDTFKGFLAQDWLHRPENLKCLDRFQKQVSS